MIESLSVFRMDDPRPHLIGCISLDPISFAYDREYLSEPNAQAVSFSLPLRDVPYDEQALIPYFEGLLPEGAARRAIASRLAIEPDNYLMLLLRCGLETIGDIAITSGEVPEAQGAYHPLSNDDLRAVFAGMEELAESNFESRLSLAGTQGKVGLAHVPGASIAEKWLRPLDGAASTHILKTGSLPDIPLLEFLCMRAAATCGIVAAPVDLLDFGKPVLCAERYDRRMRADQGNPVVTRLHQEDIAQALGIPPEAKYRELAPSTAAAIGSFLRQRSARPIEDLEAFAKITCFNYLIGNCDNHLKNLSILYMNTWKSFRLAPAYDLVSTTHFERFSRAMGMRIGSASVIDEVSPRDILGFGSEIGMNRLDLANICENLVETVPGAIEAASKTAPDFKALPYVAWDLCEDMSERLSVLDRVARSR